MLAPVILIADSAEQLRASRRYFYQPIPAHLAASASEQRGVKYEAGQLLFDRQIHTEETARLLVAHLKGEQIPISEKLAMVGIGEAATPTASDLQAINRHYNGDELTAEDVVVFQDWAASDAMMRRPLKFTKAYLQRLAESYREGRTVLLHHSESLGIGWTYDADVVKATVRGVEANWLRVKWYAVTRGASTERLQQIEDARAIYKYVSVEARGGTWEFQELEGPDGPEYFYEISDGPGAEAGELSRVYLGAVYGAGDNKLKAEASTPETKSSPTKKEREIICVM